MNILSNINEIDLEQENTKKSLKNNPISNNEKNLVQNIKYKNNYQHILKIKNLYIQP